ncbi:MAG: GTPase Era [Clostridiales Family XIII bacterium]|jgi:GTP-binding protein Era|nr:GTPase Era [Clostridiales Family XIII bacterium]
MKTGFIGIVGRPNVGKSTLLNCLTGEKVAIATDKPQTTRNRIRGILTEEGGAPGEGFQMVFIDTPGIHKPRNKLGGFMTETALGTLNEVDAVVFVVDGGLSEGTGDRHILNILAETGTPKIAAVNKIDLMPPDAFKAVFDEYSKLGIFAKVIGISAKDGTNVGQLKEALRGMLPEGDMFFPPDMFTDHPERFIVSEIIREKLLMYLDDEIPHGVAVEIESYEETPALTKIGAVIICEKKSHKGIIIGKQGRKLKGIGMSARIEIENLLGAKVFLELWVKVKENWRNNDFTLNNLGYNTVHKPKP